MKNEKLILQEVEQHHKSAFIKAPSTWIVTPETEYSDAVLRFVFAHFGYPAEYERIMRESIYTHSDPSVEHHRINKLAWIKCQLECLKNDLSKEINRLSDIVASTALHEAEGLADSEAL